MPLETAPTYPIETPQFNIAGENSAIRAANPEDPEDVKRVLDIISSKDYQRYFLGLDLNDSPISFTKTDALNRMDGDPFNLVDKLLSTPSKTTARFIVSRAVKHHDTEVGEVQGDVSVFKDESYDRINSNLDLERSQAHLATLSNSPYPRLQISWAKHPDAQEKQMASGVRQTLYFLYEKATKFRQVGDHGEFGAFVTSQTPLVVLAYIEPENVDSIRVAESCGFVYLYKDPAGHDIWQVDWNRFLTKLKQPVLKGTRPSFKKT